MSWAERVNAAIDYIEDNLIGEIDVTEAAKKALCSRYHFQRMFLAITGFTPAEYVRRRRLTAAARELSAGSERVIDVAIKYGYDSPNAFTRAFRSLHGVTPTEARLTEAMLTAYPRATIQIVHTGGSRMEYRIVRRPAFKAAGQARDFSRDTEQNMTDIGSWCVEFRSSPGMSDLLKLGGGSPGPVTGGETLGICFQRPGADIWSYAIAVEPTEREVPDPNEALDIPAATWAVFETTLDGIPECWKHVFGEWFPSTGYEHAEAPDLEVYFAGEMRGDSRCEIWVPVVDVNGQ